MAEGGQIIKKAGVSHIATGFTDIQGRYIKPASFPTAVSEVYIYSPDFGVPTLYKTKVVGSDVSAKITFENALDSYSCGFINEKCTNKIFFEIYYKCNSECIRNLECKYW